MLELIKSLPKAELHIHIEGSLEPELMFKFSQKNSIDIPYKNVEEVKEAYAFSNLQDFLDIYYASASVHITQENFYDLTWAYLLRCKEDNIIHTEIFFDPQTHTQRGIAFKTVLFGIKKALDDGKDKLGISSKLILCFLRHLSQESAQKTLKEALPFKSHIDGVGLDSSEIGNPPSKFKEVFALAKEEGFHLVAHAGEEADSSYIYEALDILNVERVDHGVQAIHDNKLMQRLKKEQVPLTVCPTSNVALKVFSSMDEHNIKNMLDKGILVTVNSDDPAYFGGYLNKNYEELYLALNLSKEDIIKLIENGFKASFLNDNEKQDALNRVNTIANRS